MNVGERAVSPEQIPPPEPLYLAGVTGRMGSWQVLRRLEALAAVIDRMYHLAPEVIDAAQRQDVRAFDDALDRLVTALARDAARVMSAEHMPRGTESHMPAP